MVDAHERSKMANESGFFEKITENVVFVGYYYRLANRKNYVYIHCPQDLKTAEDYAKDVLLDTYCRSIRLYELVKTNNGFNLKLIEIYDK